MLQQPTRILFSDLSHTRVGISGNYFPLGISFVASYLISILGDQVDVCLFKYPEDLSGHLFSNPAPTIVGFFNYSWSFRLASSFAERNKEIHPHTLTVFGGSNFPDTHDAQEQFLHDHTAIDFHVDSKEKHTKSVFDVMDIGIKEIRLCQFILLAGTEAGNDLPSGESHQLNRYTPDNFLRRSMIA